MLALEEAMVAPVEADGAGHINGGRRSECGSQLCRCSGGEQGETERRRFGVAIPGFWLRPVLSVFSFGAPKHLRVGGVPARQMGG